MVNYAKHFSLRRTPQSEPLVGTVPNTAGGHSFPVDDWTRLDRFLVLGSEGGSYYAGARALTRENAEAVVRCIAADGARAVATIVAVSEGGRAPKQDPAIFALALAASAGGEHAVATRRAALAALPRVCRTGTHLFQFAGAVEAMRGWGRGLRRAVGAWYLERPLDALAYQAVKYRSRLGWSHRDLLRLAHPETDEPARAALFDWVCRGTLAESVPALVHAFASVQAEGVNGATAAAMVRTHGLPWEPTELLTSREVGEALVERMPIGAMVRQLGRLTASGVLAPFSAGTEHVRAVLSDRERILKARLHPMALLLALRTYASGHGERGKLSWEPVAAIVEALNAAFYTAFAAAHPTGKRLVLALDVSGSMSSGGVAGSSLTPREAAAAMALVTAATENRWQVVGFTAESGKGWGHTGLTPLPIGPSIRLDAAVAATAGLAFGATDCSLPMRWAQARGIEVDAFVVYTDSETWAGPVHPVEALRAYREKTGIAAKLVVVGLVSNGFSIADPTDAGMLDVVGFDTATPTLIADFIRS